MENNASRPFEVDTNEYPFKNNFYEADGFKIHYVDSGVGIPVIMLHGNPTWSYSYRNIIKGLGQSVRSIVIDYPGFGYSNAAPMYGFTPKETAEVIDKVLKSLNLEKYILVLQDWGGPIGMEIATRYPEQILGLVICNTWAWEAQFKGKLFSLIFGGSFGRKMIIKKNFFLLKGIVSGFSNPEARTPKNLKAYQDRFAITEESRIPVATMVREVRKSGKWLKELEAKLSKLKESQVELVFGMKDPVLGNESTIQKWLEYFPKANVTRIPDANHYIQENTPKQIVEAILRLKCFGK